MTPDWGVVVAPLPYAELTDPQTFNRYSYVRNNPTSVADVDGHGWEEFKNWWKYQHWVNNAGLEKALATDAKNDIADLNKRAVTIGGKSAADLLRGKSNQQIVDTYGEINSKLEIQEIVSNATKSVPALGSILGPGALYRGGTNMEGRPGIDVRIDPNTGLITPGREISLNSDPTGLERFGGANEIDPSSIPPELEIKQVGRSGHYELTAREPMTLERFNELTGKVKFK